MAHARPVKSVRLPSELVDRALALCQERGVHLRTICPEDEPYDWTRPERMSAARVLEEAIKAGWPIIEQRAKERRQRW